MGGLSGFLSEQWGQEELLPRAVPRDSWEHRAHVALCTTLTIKSLETALPEYAIHVSLESFLLMVQRSSFCEL